MKNVTLTDAEIKVLCEMCRTAVWNANHIQPKAYECTSDQYRTLCSLYNKVAQKY